MIILPELHALRTFYNLPYSAKDVFSAVAEDRRTPLGWIIANFRRLCDQIVRVAKAEMPDASGSRIFYVERNSDSKPRLVRDLRMVMSYQICWEVRIGDRWLLEHYPSLIPPPEDDDAFEYKAVPVLRGHRFNLRMLVSRDGRNAFLRYRSELVGPLTVASIPKAIRRQSGRNGLAFLAVLLEQKGLIPEKEMIELVSIGNMSAALAAGGLSRRQYELFNCVIRLADEIRSQGLTNAIEWLESELALRRFK